MILTATDQVMGATPVISLFKVADDPRDRKYFFMFNILVNRHELTVDPLRKRYSHPRNSWTWFAQDLPRCFWP